jgi:hypothetical protein
MFIYQPALERVIREGVERFANVDGEALAAIAHPDFRDELREAAERASQGRSPVR